MSKKVYAVMNEGCPECGIETLPIAYFDSMDEAQKVADRINEKQKDYRDAYAYELPYGPDVLSEGGLQGLPGVAG